MYGTLDLAAHLSTHRPPRARRPAILEKRVRAPFRVSQLRQRWRERATSAREPLLTLTTGGCGC